MQNEKFDKWMLFIVFMFTIAIIVLTYRIARLEQRLETNIQLNEYRLKDKIK